ncbi:MAG: hypothetical protein V1678_02545 [Candidatus Aenigmatarchaeota archaeon]
MFESRKYEFKSDSDNLTAHTPSGFTYRAHGFGEYFLSLNRKVTSKRCKDSEGRPRNFEVSETLFFDESKFRVVSAYESTRIPGKRMLRLLVFDSFSVRDAEAIAQDAGLIEYEELLKKIGP